ncbi:hypothetical protein B4589_013930 [Halolamina sp. CBA1230]|uniref:hypothetical protein n=1 Tax=Halolamina sp. CBA1230 TaxID=1853690 RepID=UPI0009A1DA69|nr:hypothetical protein [Halolamina sp. CBA1230]QKY21417.1 hypothetical protein B4589_013930 [Halolamina sp. CBA1230]
MRFWDDDRAQSMQVGAIILFGFLIVGMATFQTTVVPGQNAAIEFDHSQTVQSDMQDFRGNLFRAVDTGLPQPTQVTLGTRYPNRLLFVNPPPPSGRLQTVNEPNVTMNVSLEDGSGTLPISGEHENAKEYWESQGLSYNTTKVVYSPDYAEYDNAPETVYGNSVVYNAFENGHTSTLTSQNLVQGNTLNLFALRGELSATRAGAYTADIRSVSQTARTVTVEASDGDPVFLNITSRLSGATWNSDALLGNEANATVTASDRINGSEYNRTTIKLNKTYRLRAGAIGIGSLAESEVTTEAAYLVVDERSASSVTVEVRDKFNNPVTGERVSSSLGEDRTTDESGQVTYQGISADTVEVWLTGSERNDWEELTVEVSGSDDPSPPSDTDTYEVSWATRSGDLPAGVTYDTGQDRLEVNRSVTGATVPLNGTVSAYDERIPGMPVTLATNGSANTAFESNNANTDSDGEFSGTLEVPENGTSRILASSGDGVGSETVYIYGDDSDAGSELPADAVAFADADGDGTYDDGEETYTASDFEGGFDEQVDLVIARGLSQNGYDVRADTITIQDGARVEIPSYGDTTFSARNGELRVAGTIDTSAANGQQVTLEGTSVDLTDGTVEAAGKITVRSTSGDLVADDSLLDVTAGSQQDITLGTSNELSLENARLIGDQYSDFVGERPSRGSTVYVDGAVFERGNGDPKEFDVNPGDRRGNGQQPPQNVEGTPEKGTVV